MVKFIKAVLAISIAVIFFGIIYITGKDKNGTPNIFMLGMKFASQTSSLKANKNPQQNISFGPSPVQNSFQQSAQTEPMTPEQLKAANAAMAQYSADVAEITKNNPEYAAALEQAKEQIRQADLIAASATQPSAPTADPAAAAAALPKSPLQSLNNQELTEALMVAVSSNGLEKAKQILSLGADPNTAENATSATPLFTAISNNNPQMVQLLLDHGADVNQVNEKGSYPMHEAASGNAFAGDSKYRANEMIQSLIEHGADVNQKNAKGQTALMLACKAGRTETLVFLLNKNATTSAQDEKGKTVADYASEVPAKSCSDALRKFTKEVL